MIFKNNYNNLNVNVNKNNQHSKNSKINIHAIGLMYCNACVAKMFKYIQALLLQY